MILIVDDSTGRTPDGGFREHECSLQVALRRMGFYAARPAPRHGRSGDTGDNRKRPARGARRGR